MSDPASKPPRRIACVRCRRTKKKCDHAVPVCGQCRRAGAECRQLRTQRTGDYITVPLSYYQRLEAKARAVEPGDQEAAIHAWPTSIAHIPPTPPSVNDATKQTPETATAWHSSYPDGASVSPDHQGSVQGAGGDQPVHSLDRSQPWHVSQNMSTDCVMTPDLLAESTRFHPVSTEPQAKTDVGLDMTWSTELYANIYLAHVHRMYPFLREDTVRRWMRTCARGQALEGDHKGFILRLLCAIGAFMCSSFVDDCPHLREANSLSQEAFGRFHAGSMRQGRVIRSQVCLLTLHHAIYGPRPELIHDALASAMKECGGLLEWRNQELLLRTTSAANSRAQSASREPEDPGGDPDEHIKNIVLACHQVNEIIACGWDRPGDDLPRLLDDKLSTCSDRLSLSQTSSSTHLRPFHKIRKIQHKIRLFHDAIERWGLDREAKNKWKAEIAQDVEDWRASLPQSNEEEGSYAPSSNCYTQKVYDYTICILHEADPSSMVIEDVYALLAASSDACRKYRLAQASNKGIILKNWNALVYQFRVGILLLYCFWTTPVSLRTPAYYSVESAISDCSETLLDFAKRWPTARVFHEVFVCLVAQTPFATADETAEAWRFPQEEAAKMDNLLARLRELRTHKSVLSIIEAIIQWPQSDGADEFDPFTAIGLDPMNIFELGEPAFGAEMFLFEM